MRKGELSGRAEEESPDELATGKSRILYKPLCRLCEAVASEEASFIAGTEERGVPRSDKRQDTPLKALPAVGFTDTGGQDWDDKRRDTPP